MNLLDDSEDEDEERDGFGTGGSLTRGDADDLTSEEDDQTGRIGDSTVSSDDEEEAGQEGANRMPPALRGMIINNLDDGLPG
jgi:hypothetical protein